MVKYTPRSDVDLLEKKLKKSICACSSFPLEMRKPQLTSNQLCRTVHPLLADEKTPPNTNMKRTAELAFRALDTDGSGGVNLDEFIKALERFGMHVSLMHRSATHARRPIVHVCCACHA